MLTTSNIRALPAAAALGASTTSLSFGNSFPMKAMGKSAPTTWGTFCAAGGCLTVGPKGQSTFSLKTTIDHLRDLAAEPSPPPTDTTPPPTPTPPADAEIARLHSVIGDYGGRIAKLEEANERIAKLEEANERIENEIRASRSLNERQAHTINYLLQASVVPLQDIYRREVAVEVGEALFKEIGRRPDVAVTPHGGSYDWSAYWDSLSEEEIKNFGGEHCTKRALMLIESGRRKGNARAHQAYRFFPEEVAEAVRAANSAEWDLLFTLFKSKVHSEQV